MRKVRIKGLPQASQGGTAGSGSSEGLRRFLDGKKIHDSGMNKFSEPSFEVNKTLKGVDPSEANIEAEGGEQAVVPGQGGIPESYAISGPRHAAGGVPLNLAPDSFIFSDHKKGMKIKDKDILKDFGINVSKKGKNKGFTPAEIAKKYDINEYKKVLLDPNSDKLQRETAEQMIENYNMKLGKLALVQESMKGFPQDVPAIALPYLHSIQADPNQFLANNNDQPLQAAYGAGVIGDPQQFSYGCGGENKKMAKRFPGLNVKQRGGEFTGAFWDSILQDGGNVYDQDGTIVEPNTYTTSENQPIIPVDPKSLTINDERIKPPSNYEGDFYHYDATKQKYYKTLGDRFKNTFAPNSNPRRIRQTTVFQGGGPVDENDYQTSADYAASQIGDNNYQNIPVPERRLLTPDQVTLIYGTEEEKKAVLSKLKYDAEAAGLDENAYINQAVKEMTWEEIERAEKNMKGFPIKSLKKELEWEANQLKKQAGIDTKPEQTIGEKVKTSEKPTYKVPDDAIIHEEIDEYDESKVKKGEFVRKKDGKLYQATGKTFSDIKYDQLDKIPEKYRDQYSRSYALLKKMLSDPSNKELTDKLYENYKYRISKGKIDDVRKEKLMNLPKEEVIKNLMKAQEQIYAINTHAAEDPQLLKRLESEAMDSALKKDPVTGRRYAKNEAYKDIAKSLGYTDEKLLSDDEIAILQGAYQGLSDLSRDPKFKDALDNFNLKPVGVDDQDWEGGKSISPVDDWFGNTTIGQAATAKEDKMLFKEAEIEAKKEAIRQGVSPEYIEQSTDAPWWAQDIGNMALTVAERAQLKKYLPHSSPIDLAKPDVLYFDPSRALAANAEQANIAAQTIGSFAGPQGTARLTGIQGQAFAQAANTLADYENKNVGVGNQYLNNVQQTLNQEALANNERMQRLYDQTTVANQQFDNAKTASNRNIFEAWRQGLTNATETQSLNLLYPQFTVDPSRGGPTHFTNGRPLTGQGSNANNDEAYFAEVAAYKQKYPDLDESTITAKLGPKYGKGKEPFGKDYREDLRRFVEDKGRLKRR